MRDSTSRAPPQLTHRNTKRKMRAVGLLAAADSESILRTFRFGGASRAVSVGFMVMSPVRVGNGVVAAGDASPRAPRDFSDDDAPPGVRQRRFAPESA